MRVAIDQGFGRLLVAPLVPRFLERFPQVTLRLINAEECRGRRGVRRRVAQRWSRGRERGGQFAGHSPMILCAAPAYLAGKPLPQSPSELAQHALLWAGGGSSPVTPRLAKDGGTVTLPGTPRLVAQDLTALHAAVAAGLGIGALPEFMCRNGLAMKRLVRAAAGLGRGGSHRTHCRQSGGARRRTGRAQLRGFPGGEHRARSGRCTETTEPRPAVVRKAAG